MAQRKRTALGNCRISRGIIYLASLGRKKKKKKKKPVWKWSHVCFNIQVWARENFHPKVNQDLKDPAFICKAIVFRLDRLCSRSIQHLLYPHDSTFVLLFNCCVHTWACACIHAYERVCVHVKHFNKNFLDKQALSSRMHRGLWRRGKLKPVTGRAWLPNLLLFSEVVSRAIFK